MELKINEISEDYYNSLDSKELIEVEKPFQYNHFVEIIADRQSFKLCWKSYFSFPDIYKIDDRNFFIGIDLDFLIYDFIDSKTKLSVKLDSYYLRYYLFKNSLVAVTELTVYLINIQSANVYSVIDLPDVFSDLKFDDDAVTVYCMDGSEITRRIGGN